MAYRAQAAAFLQHLATPSCSRCGALLVPRMQSLRQAQPRCTSCPRQAPLLLPLQLLRAVVLPTRCTSHSTGLAGAAGGARARRGPCAGCAQHSPSAALRTRSTPRGAGSHQGATIVRPATSIAHTTCTALQRRQYGEILQSALLESRPELGSSQLGTAWHVTDMLGGGILQAVPTASGPLLQLATRTGGRAHTDTSAVASAAAGSV